MKEYKPKTDLDLAPAYRTQANHWKARFFEMFKEVQKANKGIRRLRRKIDRLQTRSASQSGVAPDATQPFTKCSMCGKELNYCIYCERHERK